MGDFSCHQQFLRLQLEEAVHPDQDLNNLLRQQKRFIDAAASKYCRPGLDIEDFKQAARIAVWKALQSYDAAAGTPLEHYVRRSVVNAMISELRSEAMPADCMLLPLLNDYEIEEACFGVSIDSLDDYAVEDRSIDVIAGRKVINLINAQAIQLSDAELCVLDRMYIKDMTVQEAATDAHTSHQNISKHHRNALQKCRIALGIAVH